MLLSDVGRNRLLSRVLAWENGLVGSIFLSLKGALPSTIAIAAYQAPSWAKVYSTSGYFVAVVALLTMPTQPRAKFLQTLFTLTCFICIAAAVNLLMILCAVSVRDADNTDNVRIGSSGSAETDKYDACANTVAAVWLFLNVFGTTYLKSKHPRMAVAALQFNFFSIVSSIYAPSFLTMTAGLNFIRRLLITFLTAYGLASGVNLFVWPTTSRGDVTKAFLKVLSGLKMTLESYGSLVTDFTEDEDSRHTLQEISKRVGTLTCNCDRSSDAFGDITDALDFARKEIAVGKLSATQLSEIHVRLREILQPIIGLTTFWRVLMDDRRGKSSVACYDRSRFLQAVPMTKQHDIGNLLDVTHSARTNVIEWLSKGIDHINMQLELQSASQVGDIDIEVAAVPRPDLFAFADQLEQELERHQAQYQQLHEQTATKLGSKFTSENDVVIISLYLNYLLHDVGTAILRLVRFADGLVADGTMRRTRLIFPGFQPLADLMMNPFLSSDGSDPMAQSRMNESQVFIGHVLSHGKKAEHLPPQGVYEKLSNCLRLVTDALESSEAAYGLRAAVATLSVALAGFLEPSRAFFIEQRGIWAATTTAIALQPQFGAGIVAFCMRLMGTAAAAATSIAITYIANHNPAGIITLFFIQASIWQFLQDRYSSFVLSGLVGSIAVIVITGYQLQVDAIGQTQATANGQKYYPVYLLAVFRLAAIAIGVTAAFFWSVFPYPTSSRRSLRRDVGSTLFMLADYHTSVQATLMAYPRLNTAVDTLEEQHPLRRLEGARQELFSNLFGILGQLKDHSDHTRFEPRIGGKFPADTYQAVIASLSDIFAYLGVMTYVSKSFNRSLELHQQEQGGQSDDEFEANNGRGDESRSGVAQDLPIKADGAMRLYLLASSLQTGRPLPVDAANTDACPNERDVITQILDASHARRPPHPYQSTAVINGLTGLLLDDELANCTALIRSVVGEIDFDLDHMDLGELAVKAKRN